MTTNTKKPFHGNNLSEVTSKVIRIILDMSPDDRLQLYDDLKNCYKNYSNFSNSCKMRRVHGRKNFLATADFTVGGRLFQGYIKNISQGGLFVEMEHSKKLYQGTPVTLSFCHPDGNGHIKTKGKIARVADAGIGIHLNSLISKFA